MGIDQSSQLVSKAQLKDLYQIDSALNLNEPTLNRSAFPPLIERDLVYASQALAQGKDQDDG